MNTFRLTILEAEKKIFEGECVSVQVPVYDGLYGIMAKHSNFICALVPGTVKYVTANGDSKKVAVWGGMCKVENGEVLVLAQAREP